MNNSALTLKHLMLLREKINPEMSIQKALVFCLVVENDGIAQVDLEKKGKLHRGAVSKNVLDLTVVTSRRKPGPGLLEPRPDPHHRRYNLVYLTDKGRKVAKEIFDD